MKKPLKAYIFLIVVLLGAWFYWFQFRPSQIRQKCTETARRKFNASSTGSTELNAGIKKFDFLYELCLRENGLK